MKNKIKKKNDIWSVIVFGWILHGMRENGKSELENADDARKLLKYMLQEHNEGLKKKIEELPTHALVSGDITEALLHKYDVLAFLEDE